MKKTIPLLIALAIGFVWPLQALAGLNDGLEVNCPFNGNADDESGNRHHGTVYGATLTEDRFGNSNSAYDFDGVDDYIVLDNTSSLNFTTGGFTLVAWVNFIEARSMDDQFIVGKHVSGHGNGYFLGEGHYLEDKRGRLSFYLDDPRLLTSESYNDGTWHLVVGVYDDGNQFLYVDGVLDSSRPKLYRKTNEVDISIGKALGPLDYLTYFTGKIDDVRIYDRALSEFEVKQLFDAFSTCQGDFTPIDGDVDGEDLYQQAFESTGLSLESFALDFGKINCLLN